IVPWCGFIAAGIVCADVILRARQAPDSLATMARLVLFGAALLGISKGMDLLGLDLFGEHNYWKTSPWFFMRRLGWLCVVLGALAGTATLLRDQQAGTLSGVF